MKPTYEEFYQDVENSFKERWQTLDAKEAERYVASETDFIKMRYNELSMEFHKGKLDSTQFRLGGVASVAHCLEMMY